MKEKIITGLLAIFVLTLLFTIPVLFLWNWLMPIIFGLTKITFWQALGITLLCNLLFKSSSSSE